MTGGANDAADGRAGLVRLVRHLLGDRRDRRERAMADDADPGMARFTIAAEGAELVVTRPDGATRAVPPAALGRAVALGLVGGPDKAGYYRLLPPAVAFLKRALADPQDAFAGQHRHMASASVETAAGRQAVEINLAESPLAHIGRLKEKSGRPFLPPEALEAGQRLHRDFTRAQLQPRMTMAYEPRLSTRTKGSGGGGEIADSALAARSRVACALEAIGPELCGVAIDVCGFEKGLETVERERQWPARSAKLLLRAALMALARHYAPPPPAQTRRTHAWGADGFRPDLGGARGQKG
ncbi:hypothetical protein ASG25_03530 [Rhizobium sp. Leaf384]|uniref:DUF6456 domain-containing protein n=1 Tax=unclassified Rhizobium TaxID=2613769 RepID=UPI000715F989|nr:MULTISPECIES: DUF6456 domain-containing protein [unclassified Rhizobium]KQS77446.1 hypothetical protein ASG58_10795 [Rhizobium sp. Leaf383]KQS80646.1 hypothetical protein ASG25_03530 [Rhizobium sp. Leaf384]